MHVTVSDISSKSDGGTTDSERVAFSLSLYIVIFNFYLEFFEFIVTARKHSVIIVHFVNSFGEL